VLETPKTLDPDDPAHLDFLHRKILYAADERPVFWWKRGTKYGVVSGKITPMWDMWVFFVQRAVEHRDASFDVASLEAVYLTDHDTGALLEDYTNPYTGETLSLPGRLMGPETQTFDSDGGPAETSALPGVSIERTHQLGPAIITGDDIWLSVDSSAIVTRSSDAQPFRVNDLETFNAKLSDVLNPDHPGVPAQATLQLISSWQSWLNMGERPGSQVTRLVAKKAFEFSDIAVELQKLLRQLHPEIAANPVAALERPPESFER
jgi:hypothetical protein